MGVPFAYVFTCLYLASAFPQQESAACLLQRASSPRKQTVIEKAERQEPNENTEESNAGNDESNAAVSESTENGPASNTAGSEEKEADPASNAAESKPSDGAAGSSHGQNGQASEGKGHREQSAKEASASGASSKNTSESGISQTRNQTREIETVDKEEPQERSQASLRMELRLATSILELEKAKVPLSRFLEHLRKNLSSAAQISEERLDVLGMRGAYSDETQSKKETSKDENKTAHDGESVVDLEPDDKEYSIVDLEVLPSGRALDLSPKAVFKLWKGQLEREDSILKDSLLKKYLTGATLRMRPGAQGLLPPEIIQESCTHTVRPVLQMLLCLLGAHHMLHPF